MLLHSKQVEKAVYPSTQIDELSSRFCRASHNIQRRQLRDKVAPFSYAPAVKFGAFFGYARTLSAPRIKC